LRPELGNFEEVKGYKSKQWEEKEKQFPEKLIVYDYEKLQSIFKYVKEKYGENLSRLYES